ncbi:MAG: HD domain-containing protein, partial [Desulfobacteraceae bacterium]|nr:HD domain-containing protein [Desulfobacteraceae bacterium]
VINAIDAWELPYFDRSFDLKNNFRTRSVLCVPITNRSGDRIGVIQVINKAAEGRFDGGDANLLMALASSAGIALENSFLMEELEASFEGAIRTLAATVDAKHPLTAGHSQRVTEYALLIAREMNLNEDEQVVIKYAGLLHDIGKIGIKDSVLLKNGPFTPEERAEMNDHPAKTRTILEEFHFPKRLRQVAEVAAHHHEKINGQGYPHGLTGDNLPMGSKILAVADVFDALTSRRDYPKYSKGETMGLEGMPLQKVIGILEADAGSHFDPEVVSAFLRCLPKALRLYRGTHFCPEYVDDMIRSLELKNKGEAGQ